jgi:hypothetical protein
MVKSKEITMNSAIVCEQENFSFEEPVLAVIDATQTDEDS